MILNKVVRGGFTEKVRVPQRLERCENLQRTGERKREQLTNLYVMLWVLSNELDNLMSSFLPGRKDQGWVAIGVVQV
jgi:hypothetical protein